jgi:hypothetical protein
MLTPAQYEQDIAFLVTRQREAGSCTFSGDRWTGMSSNAIVCVAYGGEQDAMPWDRGDYAACVRTVKRLPRHRRTPAVMAALWAAKEHYLNRYPCHRSSFDRRAERERREKEEAARQKKREARWRRAQRKADHDRKRAAH